MRHIPLNGKYSLLTGSVATVDASTTGAEVFYEIEVDGEVVFSGTTTVGQPPAEFELGLAGATDLKLRGTQTARTGAGISIAFLDGKLTSA